MTGMFDQKGTNPKMIRSLKEMFLKKFHLPESSTLSVAELRCHEPGCPPIETVITARMDDGSIKDWRISKPVDKIKQFDLEELDKKTS